MNWDMIQGIALIGIAFEIRASANGLEKKLDSIKTEVEFLFDRIHQRNSEPQSIMQGTLEDIHTQLRYINETVERIDDRKTPLPSLFE